MIDIRYSRGGLQRLFLDRMHSASRPLLSGLLLAFMLSTAGCVVVPTPETEAISKERAQSIIGVQVDAADKLLHENDLELALQIDTGETRYHIYRGHRTSGVFIMAFFPLLAFEESRHAVGTQCLLLEAQDDTVVRGSLKSTDDVSANCPRLFWTDEEFSQIAEQWFATLATEGGGKALSRVPNLEDPILNKQLKAELVEITERGDRDAAFEMARRFEEPMFLRILAAEGDMQAAAALERRFFEPEPLRKLLEQREGDKYERAKTFDAGSKEEWALLCQAAKKGHPEAQAMIAGYFERGHGQVQKDLVTAYVWMRAAENNAYNSDKQGGYYKVKGGLACCLSGTAGQIAAQLTLEQKTRAEKLVEKGDLGEC